MKAICLFMTFFILTKDSFAQVCKNVENGAMILYMNGNFTSPKDAQRASVSIRNLNLGSFLLTQKELQDINKNFVSVSVVVNNSENVRFKAAILASENASIDVSYNRAWLYYTLNFTLGLSSEQIEALNEIFINVFGVTDTYFNENTQKLTSTMLDVLTVRKKRVILVSHSQGALFANTAYEKVFSPVLGGLGFDRQKNAGIYHIAPVSNGDTPTGVLDPTLIFKDYIMRRDDIVANGVRRLFIPTVPSWTVENVDPALASLNHGILDAYLEILKSTITSDLQALGQKVRDYSCVEQLACFEIDPNGLPGEYIKNADGTDGGFVSTGSTVAPSAYLGAEAQVCNGAQVLGNATVIGPALIADPGTVVSDSALISGDVTVDSGARVYEQAKIFDTTRVGLEAKIFGRAEVHGDSVIIGYSEISGKAKLDGRHLVVSFGDDTKKVQIKGDVKFAGSYIIAMNALIDGTFNFTKKGAVIGDVQMLGGGEIEHTGINDQVKIFTDNLTSLGAGDFGVFLLDNIRLEGSPILKDNVFLRGNAFVTDSASITGRAVVRDNAQVINFAQVKDDAMIWGDAVISGFASITGNSWVGANCIVADATLFNVNIPNLFDKSDINNLYCPGYYEPAPVGGPALALARSNFVEMTPQETWQQMYDEEVRRYQAILAEAEEIKRKYLGREYQNEALDRARAPAGN